MGGSSGICVGLGNDIVEGGDGSFGAGSRGGGDIGCGGDRIGGGGLRSGLGVSGCSIVLKA